MSPQLSNLYNIYVKEKTELSSHFRMIQSFSTFQEKCVPEHHSHILASVEFTHYLKMHKSRMTG